jgi:hypothetical protein
MVEMLLASQLGYVFISESVLFIGTQFSNLYTDTPLVESAFVCTQAGSLVESTGTNLVERGRLGLERCCLLLQGLLQSCTRGVRRIVEDMCYERRRAEACAD